jgi:hypothetical protein
VRKAWGRNRFVPKRHTVGSIPLWGSIPRVGWEKSLDGHVHCDVHMLAWLQWYFDGGDVTPSKRNCPCETRLATNDCIGPINWCTCGNQGSNRGTNDVYITKDSKTGTKLWQKPLSSRWI